LSGAPRPSEFVDSFLSGELSTEKFERNFVDGWLDFGPVGNGFEDRAIALLTRGEGGERWHDGALLRDLKNLANDMANAGL
jgi:hypothetical protein